MYLEYYLMGIIVLPGIILAIYAQIKVKSTFEKYSSSLSESGRTAQDVARVFLDTAGLNDVKITHVHGELSDHYNHKEKVIALSDSVYDSTSVSAIGVACHEVGHALQYKNNYVPIRLRNIIIPVTNFANQMLWILIILGAIFAYTPLIWVGIAFFSFSVLLNLITLPVEYNASNRALILMRESSVLQEDEVAQAKEVLNSAALTYVAALIISILNLLRLILVFTRRNSR